MHSQNLTRTEAGERIGRPKYAMFALLAGHQSWQVRDIQALIRVGCSLPEELKQSPDDSYDVASTHLKVTDGKVHLSMVNRSGEVCARSELGYREAMNFAQYLTHMAGRLDPRKYEPATTTRLMNISRGQVGTKRPGNGGRRS